MARTAVRELEPREVVATRRSGGSGRRGSGRRGPGGRAPVAAVVALAAAAAALMLWFTSAGVGVSTDSASYLAAAESIAHGGSPTTPFGPETTRYSPSEQVAFGHRIPMSEYPPLYSAVLAAPIAAGMTPSTAVRAVNVAAFVALLALVAVMLWRILRPPAVALVPVALLVLAGPTVGGVLGSLDPLGLFGFALSEAVFLPLCMLALLAGAHAARQPSRLAAGVTITAVALATLTRYVGASAGVAVAVAVVLTGGARPVRRTLAASVIAVSGLAAVVMWSVVSGVVWGGHAAKTLAWHPGNLDAHQAVDVSSAWFRLPTGLPWVIRGVIVLILVVGPAALVLLRPVRRWLHPAHPSDAAMALLVALGAFVLAYLAALAVTQVVVDASTQPNQRLLAPVQMAAYLVLAAVVGLGGDRLAARHWGGVRAGAALVAVLAAAALVAPVLGLPRLARALHHSVTAERALAAHDPLRSLPSGLILFSDNPSGLWLHTGLASYRLPTPIEFTTGRQDPDYPTDFREAGAIVAQQGGLIVVSTPELAATYTAGGVLRLIGTCATGEVLVAAPGTEGAAAAAGAC